jgi:hypothetical protein
MKTDFDKVDFINKKIIDYVSCNSACKFECQKSYAETHFLSKERQRRASGLLNSSKPVSFSWNTISWRIAIFFPQVSEGMKAVQVVRSAINFIRRQV